MEMYCHVCGKINSIDLEESVLANLPKKVVKGKLLPVYSCSDSEGKPLHSLEDIQAAYVKFKDDNTAALKKVIRNNIEDLGIRKEDQKELIAIALASMLTVYGRLEGLLLETLYRMTCHMVDNNITLCDFLKDHKKMIDDLVL